MFAVVGIYSAPAWTGNNQVDAAPAGSEQAVIEQDHNLLTETEALVKDIEAKHLRHRGLRAARSGGSLPAAGARVRVISSASS